MKVGIYAGSFDPITLGHLDIIKRAARLTKRLIIAVLNNSAKKPAFSVEERVEMIRKVTKDIPGVEVMTYSGLTVDFAKEQEAPFILRGIRCVEDFEYERNMAEANKQIGGVETIILYTRPEYAHISSTLVRDLYAYGKDVSNFVPNKLR